MGHEGEWGRRLEGSRPKDTIRQKGTEAEVKGKFLVGHRKKRGKRVIGPTHTKTDPRL